MTPGAVPTARPELTPDHRRRWLIWTVGAVVLALALVVGGPLVYARVIAPAPREPLALTTASPTVTPGADTTPVPLTAAGIEGSWNVGAGSQAGYRLGEVLSGQPVAVVGRTDKVTGTAVVAGGVLQSAEVVVDAASIVTDTSARDAYFRRALNTTEFPTATFSLTAPVDLAAVDGVSGPVTVSAPGTLTFHGVSQPVTATLQVQGTASGVEVLGTIPVTLADYQLQAPALPFVTVDPSGTVEMLLRLTR
ncbi:MAG TPA: YceI family protein [Actinotalea sp.]